MPAPPPRQPLDPSRATLMGMGLMLVATSAFGVMTVTIRLVPGDLHVFEVVFFRNLVALLLLVPWEARKGLGLLRTGVLRLHLLRAALNTVVMLAFFQALRITPIAPAVALSYVSPIISAVLAAVLLRERLRSHRILAIVAGFLGALAIVRPGLNEIHPGLLLILLSASTWAFTLIVIKVLSRTEASGTIVLYMALFMTPLTGLLAIPVWQTPNLEQLLTMGVIGFTGMIGHYAMATALRLADTTAILPMDFLRLVWSALGALWLFGEVPDLWTLIGGALIFTAATYQAVRETR